MFKYSRVLVFLLISACGKDEEVKPIDPAALQGIWLSACLSSGEHYEQKTVTFKGSELTMISSRYSDDTCTTVVDQVEGTGIYGIAGVDASKSDMTPSLINYLFKSISWTFQNDPSDAVDYAVACDSTVDDGVVDLLDKTCAISETVSITFPATSYGIVEIRGGQLFITDFDRNSAAPESRPTQYPSLEGLTLQVAVP
jgi:hypothetical protein